MIQQGFRSLPVILATTVLILGMTQGNVNFLFFFVGMFLVTPTSTLIVNRIWELLVMFFPGFKSINPALYIVKDGSAAQCAVFSTDPSAIQNMIGVPSYWMAMTAFFFTYLFVNGLTLYNMKASDKAPKYAVDARKSQAAMSMAVIVAVAIIVTIFRFATSCETGLGILFSWGLGGGLAYGWYSFMRACGLGRLDDIFGIANRILPLQSYEDKDPTVCAPAS
jgi:hypothetical protein